jgi:hypothetical protein
MPVKSLVAFKELSSQRRHFTLEAAEALINDADSKVLKEIHN